MCQISLKFKIYPTKMHNFSRGIRIWRPFWKITWFEGFSFFGLKIVIASRVPPAQGFGLCVPSWCLPSWRSWCWCNGWFVKDWCKNYQNSMHNRFKMEQNRPNWVPEALLEHLGPISGPKTAPRSTFGRFWEDLGRHFGTSLGSKFDQKWHRIFNHF